MIALHQNYKIYKNLNTKSTARFGGPKNSGGPGEVPRLPMRKSGPVSMVKTPNFIATDPQLLFSMVETSFELVLPKPITENKIKYNHCVVSLPSGIVVLVRDIILSTDATDPYIKLKDSVIKKYGESSSLEIRR